MAQPLRIPIGIRTRTRCALCLLALSLAIGGRAESAEHVASERSGPRPLALNLHASAATHALILASQGDAAGFAEIPPELFRADVA
nr:hypothetical protein [Planctomycetota bacterium]